MGWRRRCWPGRTADRRRGGASHATMNGEPRGGGGGKGPARLPMAGGVGPQVLLPLPTLLHQRPHADRIGRARPLERRNAWSLPTIYFANCRRRRKTDPKKEKKKIDGLTAEQVLFVSLILFLVGPR